EAPAKHAVWIELESRREALNAPFDCAWVSDERNMPRGIPQQRPDLERQLTDDAFRIDRDPTSRLIVEHVLMLKVAVQQPCLGLRLAELAVHLLRVSRERLVDLTIAALEVPIEASSP